MLAGELGDLSLTLRRPNDDVEGPGEGQTVQMLAGIEEEVEPISEPVTVEPPIEPVAQRGHTGRILAIRGY